MTIDVSHGIEGFLCLLLVHYIVSKSSSVAKPVKPPNILPNIGIMTLDILVDFANNIVSGMFCCITLILCSAVSVISLCIS